MILSTSDGFVTSNSIASALPISSATFFALAKFKSVTTTKFPRLANSFAIAAPIPEPAPVTTAIELLIYYSLLVNVILR